MDIKIKQSEKNTWPLSGILIRGAQPVVWLKALGEMGVDLQVIRVFAVPGATVNSVWGCFVETTGGDQSGPFERCQLVHGWVYIPERSTLFPVLTRDEVAHLFLSKPHMYHPDFGWVELGEPVEWGKLLDLPVEQKMELVTPASPIFIPEKIASFRAAPADIADVLTSMEQQIVGTQQPLQDAPLDTMEKVKFAFYKTLFGSGGGSTGAIGEAINGFISKFPGINPEFLKKWQQDFEELEKRNQKKVDRLLDMFKDNPENALKYALPLDEANTSRGNGMGAELDINEKWFDFNIFGNSPTGRSGGPAAVIANDDYFRLQQQYMKSAKELEDKQEYYKAAFIYLKLLKNHHLAAAALEKGKYYQEAATIYLKHLNNKKQAAVCYEAGFMYREAIELYKELEDFEKAGDLYILLNKKKEANQCYHRVAANYAMNSQYLKASLIYKNKVGDLLLGQNMLLDGWRSNADAFNCINNYFNNIESEKELKTAIEWVYQDHVDRSNRSVFLQALKHEYGKFEGMKEMVRTIAHEIIVAEIPHNSSIAAELKSFQPENQLLMKDALLFRYQKGSR